MLEAEPRGQQPYVYHALSVGEVLALLDVSVANGLNDEKVRVRAHAHGPNTIISRRRIGALLILAHQLKSPVVYLLAAAAALAFIFEELEEGIAITLF